MLPKYYLIRKNIAILHGLGDFIAVESYLADEECASIEHIYWASHNKEYIQSAIRFDKLFPNLKSHEILWDKFDERHFKVNYKEELILYNKDINQFWLTTQVLDAGLPTIMTEIEVGWRTYQKSRIAEMEYDLPKDLILPEKFVLIHPWSDTHRTPLRDFNKKDWQGVLKFLELNNLIGVVVNKSVDYPPAHSNLIDLTNKISIQEVFAIAKKATYFAGCASFLHVLMPRILKPENIFIRSSYPHLETRTREFNIYHGPATKDPNFKTYYNLNFLRDYKI